MVAIWERRNRDGRVGGNDSLLCGNPGPISHFCFAASDLSYIAARVREILFFEIEKNKIGNASKCSEGFS